MISVIIPAVNEAEALPLLLADLAQQDGIREIIVVDGGSSDATQAIAANAGARVIETHAGRGTQLRAGGTGGARRGASFSACRFALS